MGKKVDESAKANKDKDVEVDALGKRYRPEKPNKFWAKKHDTSAKDSNEPDVLDEFMMQQPEETCRLYKLEGRGGILVSLDRDQEAAPSKPKSSSKSPESAIVDQ